MATGSRVCPHCGALNAIDDKECYRCKKRLPGKVGASLDAVRGAFGESAPMTYFFVLLCVVVYFLMTFVVSAPRDLTALVRRLWVLPGVDYVRWGSLYYGPPFPTGLGRMEPWRFISAMFVHLNVLHIVFNSSALFYYGRVVEERIGSARFTICFFATGVLGFLASDVWYVGIGESANSAGASGAIFGLIGVFVGYLFAKRDPEYKRQLASAIVMALIVGFLMRVNNAAHVGGFVAGLPLGWLFYKERRPDRLRPVMNALAVIAVLASLASLVLVQRSPWWRV
jgi:membrane associated rhomboid family serine protease